MRDVHLPESLAGAGFRLLDLDRSIGVFALEPLGKASPAHTSRT